MDVIRPAGLNEKRCIVREYLVLYNNIITIGTYRGPAPITESDAIKALKRCIIEHPALSTSVRYVETEKFELVRPAKVDVNQHLHISNDSYERSASLQYLLALLHNDPIAETDDRPQWRAYIVPLEAGFHLAFACSHALADGMSTYAFHTAFLQALRDLGSTDQDDNAILDTSKHWAPLPALETAGSLSVSWSFLIGPVVNEYFPAPLARLLGLHVDKPANTWLGAPGRPALPQGGELLPTAVSVLALPGNIVEAVLTKCRLQSARLTGLLNIVAARALANALRSRGLGFTSFQASTAIDLRQALGAGSGKMANYVSAATETIVVDDTRAPGQELSESDWHSIREITTRLSAASQTLADQPIGLLKYLSNFREWTLKNARAPADSSFEVSNLGVFNGTATENSGWSVDQILFSQSANGTGPPVNFSVATAKGGDLTIAGTWWRGMLGVADEEDFMGEVCKGIDGILRGVAAH